MPFLVKLALFRTEVAHAQGCPVPAELRTEEWSWWMGDAGGAAGCQLPLARAQQEIPGVQLPNIRSKLAGFLKSCTGWRGTWKTGVFLMLRGRRKQANLISKQRGSSTDGWPWARAAGLLSVHSLLLMGSYLNSLPSLGSFCKGTLVWYSCFARSHLHSCGRGVQFFARIFVLWW